MKKILISLLLLSVQIAYGQDCNTQAANKPSTYDPNFQSFLNPVGKPASWDISKMKPHLAKVESWMRNTLKGFTGAKLMYGNYYFLDPTGTDFFYKQSGLKGSYEGIMMFFAYYCYENKTKIETEGESGSNIKVDFNNVFASGLTTDAGVYSINGKNAFKILQKKRSEGRIDFYEQRVQDNATAKIYTANDYIVLRNSDKPLFIPVTRKEYLQQMLIDAENFGSNDTKQMTQIYANNAKQFEEEMKVYKLDKSYTPEKEAKRRKWFEEDQEKLKKIINKTSPDVDAAKDVILQYLKKPAAWLNKGFKDFHSFSTYTAAGVTQYFESMDKSFLTEGEQESKEEIVTINPAYYNNKLGADVPQVITVHLQNGIYAHMLKVNKLIMQPGALAPLEAILNPGKSTTPATVPPVITSTYSLSYLPKLNSLTPLVIPADMKPSLVTATPAINPPVNKFNFEIPALSPKLKQLPPQPFTADAYKNYVTDLHTQIASALKPEIKKKTDGYVKQKKLTQTKAISNAALAAWLQKTPTASLYLYSMAVVSNLSDGLAANNFSAFLIMGGLPEKSIPVLEYWNKQKPGEATLLANLGNAYYRLGDVKNAMKFLQQCVQKDSLHPTANKLLCIMYLKKGDVKKAEEHAKKSITKSYDEEVVTILRQLNNKIKVGEIMSRFPALPAKEFPMLKRSLLPAMPSQLDNMAHFIIELNAMRQSVSMTIDAISAKYPRADDDGQQQMLKQGLKNGISPMFLKAQYIIMDGMQNYQEEQIKEADIFKYNLKALNIPHNAKMKAIQTKYNAQINKLEGGEAGDEDKIQALEKAECIELNTETQAYLTRLSNLVNQHAQRQEYISRKFYRDYANWAPYWEPQSKSSFPTIERDYLKDISIILSNYPIVSKTECSDYDPLTEKLTEKQGSLQEWEDEYCANFKMKYGIGAVKVFATCNSWGVEGGEGVVGDLEVKYSDDGSFEDFTIGAGFGETWNVGKENFAGIEASASIKEFIKFGKSKSTNAWEVKDFGLKSEITLEGRLGKVSSEIKILEISASVNAGINVGGVDNPILFLK